MNIFTPENQNNKVLSLLERAKKLHESFLRCPSKNEFLLEHGNTKENEIAWNFISLNESMKQENRFTFENGMYIPGLGSTKGNSKYTLDGIYESSSSEEEFIEKVNTLCESKLDFTLSKIDKSNLLESYDSHKIRL